MPLYEYECTSCHRRIEKIQKFSDPDLTICPSCNGKLERTITAAAVSFKGGGWYKDGYASVKPAASGGESAAGSSDATGSAPASSGAGAGGASDSGSSTKSTESSKSAPAPATTAAATTPSSTPKA